MTDTVWTPDARAALPTRAPAARRPAPAPSVSLPWPAQRRGAYLVGLAPATAVLGAITLLPLLALLVSA